LKAGYEYRPIYLNNTEPGTPSGGASFDGAWTGLNQQAPLAQQGLGFASFLLGLPSGFSFESSQAGWSVAFKNHGLYLQDDWKVARTLTLNLGLRWEYEMPMTERFDRLGFIDYDRESGVRVNSGWNFATDVANRLPAGAPAPNLGTVNRIGLGLVNTGDVGRGNTQKVLGNFGPRVGFAWQLRPRTVVRGGMGILYSGYTGNASGSGSLGIHPFFRTSGNALISSDNGRTISATLSNPFPNNVGLLFGTNDPAEVQNRSIGGSYPLYQFNHRPSYEIAYNFGLQQQVGKWALESTFIGNRGVHLYVGGNPFVSTLPPQYLALGSALETPVPNPFANAGNPENGYQITRPTIPYKTLLSDYPHLSAGSVRVLQRPTGNSIYLAGFFRAERRFGNGFSFGAAYTVSKLIEDTAAKTGTVYGLPQDGRNFRDLRGISVQDIPQKLAVSYLYELPIGRGRRLLGSPATLGSKVLEAIAGGWQLAGFSVIQSGYPLQITQSDDFTGGMGYGKLRPTLTGNYKTDVSVSDAVGFPNEVKGRYVNRDAFSVTPRYQFGTAPPVLPNMRQPRWNQTDLAILKKFRFSESRYFEVRGEARNAFNHSIFQLGNNEMNIQNANFGTFQSTANEPRNVQIGARFVF
ncbi:MAG: TonB-dependent receptor, partial [Bryobacteraceae bacterium]|nr:TonB-dependent receptor [Bryobacteraceae bacterium]